ncbi:hypothetical protein [Xanthocytophaga flava]|uniref:hypothetical protein n=1 Tax=Xanthocytophaga flava TaxID=3048013 RepID=UPI0028D54D51|nr:hypothetical protein [Xanthocytophaga flavus]
MDVQQRGNTIFMSIMMGATIYYALLQFFVINLRRKEIQHKSAIFAGLILFELLPTGYVVYKLLAV